MRNLVLVSTALLLAVLSGRVARARGAAGNDGKTLADSAKKSGSVLTFYGLRKLEEDPNVPDEEKLKEWQAFIDRANEQVQYAKKAVDRWKNAARLRLIEAAKNADRDLKVSPKDKIAQWKEVERLYPKDAEARTAKKRIAFWTQEETKRLVKAAEEVERSRRTKVDRIQAWMEVLTWIDQGPEAKAANKRIDSLQEQLFSEAQSVDAIARVDDKTKLAAWKDVLAGRPNDKQQKAAERRVAELDAALGTHSSNGGPSPDAGTADAR